MIVINKKCHSYFRGIDGLGTCDTECQWWLNDYLTDDFGCFMWTPREKWKTNHPLDKNEPKPIVRKK